MSLILEALRKSEAERQRGRTPDLFAMPVREPAAQAIARPRAPVAWLAVGALVLACGVAFTPPGAAQSRVTVYEGARVITGDGSAPIENATFVVDGARILFPQGWGLVRASNTQPVLVMRFEAPSQALLNEYRREVEEVVQSAVQGVATA